MKELTWVEISDGALKRNVKAFRGLVGKDVILCPCVKANAYGHGLVEAGRAFLDAGADWLGVNALFEARKLREAMVGSPIYIMGYVPKCDLAEAVGLDCRLVVYNRETIDELGKIVGKSGEKVRIHLKVETGNNRQGILPKYVKEFVQYAGKFDGIEVEGLATHFANIEDTTDHGYADMQLERFKECVKGLKVPIAHCANSAATILFKKTHFNMVRPGIACYGMWPSKETYVSYMKEVGGGFELEGAFTWKTRVAQVKVIEKGESIGYGCTFKTGHESKIAILPVGYYDGYDRGAVGGHVLIRGKRAPIRGRICMNIMMVEVTDIPNVRLEDEVVLIGRDCDEVITPEMMAGWMGTINYEVTTRVNKTIPRVIVP
ncbi:MAG: alanine racemase [Candidatus Peregrinibacteria bacterium]